MHHKAFMGLVARAMREIRSYITKRVKASMQHRINLIDASPTADLPDWMAKTNHEGTAEYLPNALMVEVLRRFKKVKHERCLALHSFVIAVVSDD